MKHELPYTVSTRYNLGRLEIVARIGENCNYIYIYIHIYIATLDSMGIQSYKLTKLIKCPSNMTTLVMITESTTSLE